MSQFRRAPAPTPSTQNKPGDRGPRRAPRARDGEPAEGAKQPPRGEGGRSAPRRTEGDTKPARQPAGEARRAQPPRPSAAPKPAPSAPRPAAKLSQEGVRLSKVMAERGLCSRREADELIEKGWVFVNGQRISELGTRIDPNATITLAPQARNQQQERVTILLHKPVGYVSGQPEPGYQPAVSLIARDTQFRTEDGARFQSSMLKGLAPAGRLDIDSTGLLVLTQDGRVARHLIGDDSEVEKEYLVRVEGQLREDGLALLNHGLSLDGQALRPAKVEWLNEDQLRFVLKEGRKRQIRRMCELVGLKVVGLKRVRIGRVRLGDLPQGQWRILREDERF